MIPFLTSIMQLLIALINVYLLVANRPKKKDFKRLRRKKSRK
jgi:hypothetical protein